MGAENSIPASESALTRPNPDNYKTYVEWQNPRFAEGRFRNAYMGTWIRPREKEGQKCVVKERKDTYTWKGTDWKVSENIVKKAQELAAGFNSFSKTDRPISFTDVQVIKVVMQRDPNATPKLDEHVIVENYIYGDFKKWCNNYGFISDEAIKTASSMPAFMHWSWVHTQGQLMIADLQGVRKEDRYCLTDPVILSLYKEYGATDMGVEGMALFFLHHKCNDFCKYLPRPQLNDFLQNPRIPRQQIVACIQVLQQVSSATTYTFELQLTEEVQTVIIEQFRSYFTSVLF